jgi:hypothetical protein
VLGEHAPMPWADDIRAMISRLPAMASIASDNWANLPQPLPDYLALVSVHNRRTRL